MSWRLIFLCSIFIGLLIYTAVMRSAPSPAYPHGQMPDVIFTTFLSVAFAGGVAGIVRLIKNAR